MKEAGRSISATRSIGSVATIGRVGRIECGTRFSVPTIGRPVNPGLRINSYIAPGISNGKFGTPEGFRISPVQSRTKDVGEVKPPSFRPLEIPNNSIRDRRVGERHSHRRMPRKAYHEAHNIVPETKAIIKEIRNELTHIPPAKPKFSEPIRFGDVGTNRKITAEAPTVYPPKKVGATESSTWENKLLNKTELKTNLPDTKNTQSVANRKTVERHTFAERIYSVQGNAKIFELPNIQRLRFARQNSLSRPETTTMPAVKIDEETAQKKKVITSVPRLSRVRILPDEDLDLEEELRLKTSKKSEIKSQINMERSKKQKLKELFLSAFIKTPMTTDKKEDEQKDDDEVKFGIDTPTNKARLSAIATFRAYVTRASALIGIEPNWSGVANLFYKNRNKSLKSELVRDLNREDGTIKKITSELQHKGVIFPDARVDKMVLSHPAVTAPRKHVSAKATKKNVAEVMDLSDYDQAA